MALRTRELEEANLTLSKSPPRPGLLRYSRRPAKALSSSDPDYRILAINQAFSQVTGFTQEEMVGRTVTDIASLIAISAATSPRYAIHWN